MPSAIEVLNDFPIVFPSTLGADSRICTICWRAYAEPAALTASGVTDRNGNESETARRLPCGHVFGYNCLHEWIVEEGATSCPMCRTVIVGLEGYPGYQGGDEEPSGDEQGEDGEMMDVEENGSDNDSNEEFGDDIGNVSPIHHSPAESSDDGTIFPYSPDTPRGSPTQQWAPPNQEVSDQELLSGEDADENMVGDNGDDEMEDYEGDDEGDEDDADEEEEEAEEILEIGSPFGLTSQHSGASGTSQKTITALQSPLSPPFQPVSDEELLGEDGEDVHGHGDELLDEELDDQDEDGFDDEGDEDVPY